MIVLEKGAEYEFGTWPHDADVEYWAQDDMAEDAPLLMSWWGYWDSFGTWTEDGAWSLLDYPGVYLGDYYRGNVISIASFPSNEPAPQKKLVARGTSGINKITYIGDLTDGAGDTDGDGLTDWEEVRLYGTDPREPDTDCDGLTDGAEVGGGKSPNAPTRTATGCRTALRWRHTRPIRFAVPKRISTSPCVWTRHARTMPAAS